MVDTDVPAPRNTNHDSPWKEALESRFPEFMALLFPHIDPEINWPRGYQFLDKELQQITPDANNRRRYADKLAKVYTLDGDETWVLIHVEVQGEPERAFSQRMYTYHYRLLDRYDVDVVSLAVLADRRQSFRPNRYQRSRWGCELDFCFPMAKLLDWDARWSELEASDNVFALVVMAQIKAKTCRSGQERHRWKLHLIRLMYDRGYDRAQVLELFRVIDWMIQLPAALEQLFWDQVKDIEEAKKMPYVTTGERIGIEKGLKQGRMEGRVEGRMEGQLEGRRETARNLLLTTDLDDTTIARATNLSEAEIRDLRAETGH